MDLYTPLGEQVNRDDLAEMERVECEVCGFAVLEDEFIPCDECDLGCCLYCYEEGRHEHWYRMEIRP